MLIMMYFGTFEMVALVFCGLHALTLKHNTPTPPTAAPLQSLHESSSEVHYKVALSLFLSLWARKGR